MNPRKRILLLILIMAVIVLTVEFIAISMLYRTAIEEQEDRLQETVISQARLIESIFRFNSVYLKNYPGGAKEIPLKKLFQEKPGEVLKRAVLGMLPKNKLRARMIKRLIVE